MTAATSALTSGLLSAAGRDSDFSTPLSVSLSPSKSSLPAPGASSREARTLWMLCSSWKAETTTLRLGSSPERLYFSLVRKEMLLLTQTPSLSWSSLDLLQYVEGVEAEQLKCELHRYSTEGGYVRWPVLGAREYNHWFICILRHSRGRFTVAGTLRHPSDQPPPGQPDYHNWSVIADKEVLTTTVAMVIKTQTPSVKARLKSQQKLHCQFDVDHKGAKVTVEWHRHRPGERTKLFSYNRRTGQTEGSGVGLRALAAGDASYTLASTTMISEGTYICSVSVNPLFAKVDIYLQIEESPHVSLNVGTTLLLQEGKDLMVKCEANGYYPRDVEIIWYEEDPGTPHPKPLNHSVLFSHKVNRDMTFLLSGVFYLQAALRDSGKKFTCSVSHQSLKVPITKSFTLIVEGECQYSTRS
uniref:Ig-like domain-containing protein n=1 Tax=Neolamprologus brichardi TaxID=32507 RepID=A0A3Q4HCJ8_NEOBR